MLPLKSKKPFCGHFLVAEQKVMKYTADFPCIQHSAGRAYQGNTLQEGPIVTRPKPFSLIKQPAFTLFNPSMTFFICFCVMAGLLQYVFILWQDV